MSATFPKTVPQVAADFGVGDWLIRRLADELSDGKCPRVGWHVRLIDAALAERIREALSRRGLLALPEQEVATHA